jgi:hypothetical protein
MRRTVISEVRLPRLFETVKKADIAARVLMPSQPSIIPLPPSRSLSNPFLERQPRPSSQSSTHSAKRSQASTLA